MAAWPGFEPAEDIKLQQDIDTIAGYNPERVVKALNKAMQPEPGGNFDVEYTIINPKNPAPRMVRARGKTLFNNPW